MTATEDPVPPLSTEATGTAARSDDLEHWLSDLRTEVAANPSDWIDAHPNGEQPPAEAAGPEPGPQSQPETSVSEPERVGRHRSPD